MNYVMLFLMFSHASDGSCDSLSSLGRLLGCISKKSTALQVQNLKIEELELAQKFARQHPNPEIDVDVLSRGSRGFSVGLAYLHKFERGNKANLRAAISKQTLEIEKIRTLLYQEQLFVSIIRSSYRLRTNSSRNKDIVRNYSLD